VVHGLLKGQPPTLDLAREAALQRVLVEGAASGLIQSAHDCAEGGLAITVAECVFGTGLGAVVDLNGVGAPDERFSAVTTLFGESASRVVVSVAPQQVPDLLSLAARERVPATRLGEVGGAAIRIAIDGVPAIETSVADAERVWSTAIESRLEPDHADVR
jgi:phosphoribosylformylglycinamidine synthase